jgi:hypothetical protein
MNTTTADFSLEQPAPDAGVTSIGVGSSALLGSVFLLDNEGAAVRHGDTIGFSYGIPPVGVRAQVEQRGKSLFALTPGHTPAECNLRSLRRYIGEWFRLPNAKIRDGEDRA